MAKAKPLTVFMAALVLLLAFAAGCETSAQETPASSQPSPPTPGKLVVAVGARGAILTSTDEGRHWRRFRYPTGDVLCAVDFADARSGWAVGSGGLILHTADGGRTWVPQRSGFEGTDVSLTGVSCASTSDVWAVGDRVLHTIDGGAHWRRVSTAAGSGTEVLRDSSAAIASAHENDGWAGGYQVVGTHDGGAAWSVAWAFHPDRLALNPRQLTCADSDHVWAAGGIGTGRVGAILASSDGGATWRQQLRTPDQVGDLCCSDADHVWAIDGERVYRSSDGGRHWRSRRAAPGSALAAIAFSNARDGWLVTEGDRPAIYVSHDGGATWRRQTSVGSAFAPYLMDVWASYD